MKACVYLPKDKDKADLFVKLKSDFGYDTASKVYNVVVGQDFINTFKDSLDIRKGIPTYDSVLNNTTVQKYIGVQKVLNAYNKRQPHLKDTLDNTAFLINKAIDFNRKKENNKFIAIVDYDDNSNLTIKIEERDAKNSEVANTQRKIQKMNEKIAEFLKPLGVTMSMLSQKEVAVGRVGRTNFEHAQDIANGFAGLMQIANNMEGHEAISEEFSHFLIGILRDSPLVKRTINFLSDEAESRKILGEEFDDVYQYHNGDMMAVAEEAAGQILRNSLLNIDTIPVKKPLFKRMVDYVKNLFKRFNPGYYKDSIDRAIKDINTVAERIVSNKQKISRQDVLKARRIASFNALSKRVEKQIEVMQKIEERTAKVGLLTQNLRDKIEEESRQLKAIKIAQAVHKAIDKNVAKEETMAAIAAYIEVANEDIDTLYKQLEDIDKYDTQDRFIILRNILLSLQTYAPTMDDLFDITRKEFLQDEAVKGQSFMVEDYSNNLEPFETSSEVEAVDTSRMTPSEIASRIMADSSDWELSKDESHYINKKTKEKAMRVTKTIQADRDSDDDMDDDSPWGVPSSNIGTGIDELVRDFLSGRIREEDGEYYVEEEPLFRVYPNASGEALNSFVKALEKFKAEQTKNGITLLARDVTVNGTISTEDGAGRIHTVNVAGTLDLLGYDNEGNWYIYDMKTHRSPIGAKKKAKYERQLALYKKMLEDKYGIKIKSLSIIPIKVSYPTPKGIGRGTVEYTVSSLKPELYNGRHPNQLLIDGDQFRGANPKLEEVMELKDRELNIRYNALANDPTNGLGDALSASVNALDGMNRKLTQLSKTFEEKVMPEWVKFLKPFVGENIRIAERDEKGKPTGRMKTISIKELVESSPGDVSLLQRWLTSMADNPDALLQVFDKVYKIAKDLKRLKTITMSQKILALGVEYEQKGIKSYNWMFEADKKNYINHLIVDGKDLSYNKYDYEQAKERFIKNLDKQYGEHPEIGSEDYDEKNKKLKEWIKENTYKYEDEDGIKTIPNPDIYPSSYQSLSSTKKEFYDKWMALKAKLDEVIGPEKTWLTNTIKIRKSGIERVTSTLSGHGLTEFVNSARASVKRSFDDAINYKDGDVNTIRDVDGGELMRLPLYYINADKTDDLSTDVIGTLVAYADMAYNYQAMNDIVNPLEIGRFIAKNRDIEANRGKRRMFEDFSFAGHSYRNRLYTDTSKSNFMQTLDDFFESKIYGRYLSDNGEIWGMDRNKLAGKLLKLGSTVQLGFNLFAGVANIITGIGMQNIEAFAGEFFRAKTLAKADAIFGKEMFSFVGDIGKRVKKSKLALIDEMFDVRQNFSTTVKQKDFLNKFLLTRVFGPGIQYICQDAGDHWLYNRAAISVLLEYKMKDKKGNIISLWDALEPVDIVEGKPEYGKKLKVKDGVTKEDGTELTERDISDISGRMRYINQHCFGIYNEEDQIAARRTIVGRFFMQYRDWIPSMYRHRFGAMSTNLEKGGDVEGFYRSAGRFIKNIAVELKNGERTIPQIWKELDSYQKKNILRARNELIQLGLMWALRLLLKSDDKDRPWLERFASYMATRETTELGALVPGPNVPEMITLVKSPFANTSVVSDITNLSILFNPYSYTDEVKSGDYKGHSSAYRAFMRSPLTLWYRTVKRTFKPEKAEQYYGNK